MPGAPNQPWRITEYPASRRPPQRIIWRIKRRHLHSMIGDGLYFRLVRHHIQSSARTRRPKATRSSECNRDGVGVERRCQEIQGLAVRRAKVKRTLNWWDGCSGFCGLGVGQAGSCLNATLSSRVKGRSESIPSLLIRKSLVTVSCDRTDETWCIDRKTRLWTIFFRGPVLPFGPFFLFPRLLFNSIIQDVWPAFILVVMLAFRILSV